MIGRLFVCFTLFVASAAVSRADAIYEITLNTASLIGNASAPFGLVFQLTSGDTSSGVVNIATLSQFNFGPGGSSGSGSPFSNSGNTSGNLSSTVTLNTSGGTFFSEFSQYFTPGNLLTFQLDLTNAAEPPPTPDEFTFQLTDKTNAEVSTTDPSGSNSLIIIDLTGSALSPQTYTANGDGLSLTPQLAPVPEPRMVWPVAVIGFFFAIQRLMRRLSYFPRGTSAKLALLCLSHRDPQIEVFILPEALLPFPIRYRHET